MQGVLLVPPAIFIQLDLVLQLLFIPGTMVIDVLTDRALEFNEIVLWHDSDEYFSCFLEPLTGFEPVTFSLPWRCSTN